jgi:low affinity Fe/Cu permease
MKVIRAVNAAMERFSLWVTHWTGSTPAFVLSVLLILGWLITGPVYHYCDTWQLVANTFTTLVEFVMVFVLQRAQNKDTDATQSKLNEILAKLDSERPAAVESKETAQHTEVKHDD